jgi:hypothetical protein
MRDRSLRLATLVLLVALPVAADAPRDPPQYDPFDKDTTTIKDNFTKLEWDRRPSGSGVTHDVASGTCGKDPSWRLPTVKELLSIVDEEPHLEYEFGKNVSKTIDQLAFPDTDVSNAYWTLTPGDGTHAGMHWVVDFTTGKTSLQVDSARGNYRCVR